MLKLIRILIHLHFVLTCGLMEPDMPAPTEQKQLATWGTDIPDDLLLDQGKLAEALKKVFFSPSKKTVTFLLLAQPPRSSGAWVGGSIGWLR